MNSRNARHTVLKSRETLRDFGRRGAARRHLCNRLRLVHSCCWPDSRNRSHAQCTTASPCLVRRGLWASANQHSAASPMHPITRKPTGFPRDNPTKIFAIPNPRVAADGPKITQGAAVVHQSPSSKPRVTSDGSNSSRATSAAALIPPQSCNCQSPRGGSAGLVAWAVPRLAPPTRSRGPGPHPHRSEWPGVRERWRAL